MNKSEQIVDVYLKNKEFSNAEIAEIVKTSKRHVRRVLNPIRKDSSKVSQYKNAPKILLLDIETVMMEAFVWFLGKQRISYSQVTKEWNLVSWAAKWLFDSNVMSDIQTPEEAINRDDKRILQSIWDLINEADICIGHNAASFDLRKLNTRFLYHGLLPTHSYQSIDTLKELKRYFSMSSYKLDDVCNFLGLPVKVDHGGFGLWKKCLKGDTKALKLMNKYNINDVRITEELYLKIRPWIKSHPNWGLYMEADGSVCPNCGSDNLVHVGRYYTPAGRFLSFRCQEENCGAICRSRYADLDQEERKQLVISVAR